MIYGLKITEVQSRRVCILSFEINPVINNQMSETSLWMKLEDMSHENMPGHSHIETSQLFHACFDMFSIKTNNTNTFYPRLQL